jgi:acyl-CoA reductase-like NAD-dependent aldehyde dehydrogenase/NAD(P)-dependent dehydrogenase (short-subunit alcohol dehydrogenase family)
MIDVLDPSTEEVLDRIPEGGAAAVDAAVAAADGALDDWSRTPLEARLAALETLADKLERRADELARTLAQEMGMPLAQAAAVQVTLPVAGLRATVAVARRFPFEETDGAALLIREPAGVVAAITPWNFPLHQIAAKLGPALAAGCTMVLKPSELAPLNALILAEAADAALPRGVLTVVTGSGPLTGEPLVRHPGVRVVSLTGSVAAGRRVAAIAGDGLKRVCLELGGKSPSIVLDDADAEQAIRVSAERCFFNAGQACNAPTRLLVPRGWMREAEVIAAEVAGSLRVGPALVPGTTMGPVISAQARDRINAEVDRARRDGIRQVAGGDRPAGPVGYFVAPAVFSEVAPAAPLAQRELFGPVLAIQSYGDDADAVRVANATPYGLSAEVWSGDPQRARHLAGALRCGQVKLNGVRARDTLTAPFGGTASQDSGGSSAASGWRSSSRSRRCSVPDPILVTGSASGIGAATVGLLRDAGREVIGVDRRGAELECDLADRDAVDALAARLPARLGGVAHVAGVPGTAAPRQVLHVNLLAPRRLSEQLAARIVPEGAIVYVASVAAGRCPLDVEPLLDRDDDELARWVAQEGLDGAATYDLTKKALVSLAVRQARRWLPRRIRVLSVSPGPTDTPILRDFVATMGADRIDGARAAVGRHGTPQDSGAAIAFLLGPGAAWVNAVDLRVDGGLIGTR